MQFIFRGSNNIIIKLKYYPVDLGYGCDKARDGSVAFELGLRVA
jgi:hypothetical protein